MIINSYGLHWAPGGIPFLVQAENVENLISSELGNPFTLKLPLRGITCPHNIDLNLAVPAPAWLEDPLAEAMLPIPGYQVSLLVDRTDRFAKTVDILTQLTSPTEVQVQPVWWASAFSGRRRYMATNIGPMVWTGVEAGHLDQLVQHLDMARVFKRRMLVVAREELPIYRDICRIESELVSAPTDDMRAVGAGVLRRYMEHEQTN